MRKQRPGTHVHGQWLTRFMLRVTSAAVTAPTRRLVSGPRTRRPRGGPGLQPLSPPLHRPGNARTQEKVKPTQKRDPVTVKIQCG